MYTIHAEIDQICVKTTPRSGGGGVFNVCLRKEGRKEKKTVTMNVINDFILWKKQQQAI